MSQLEWLTKLQEIESNLAEVKSKKEKEQLELELHKHLQKILVLN